VENSAAGGITDSNVNITATAGSGLGAAIFNLNGSVHISFSTIAQNSITGSNAGQANVGPGDGTIYSLAFGNKIQDGTASIAALTLANSIVYGSIATAGAGSNDVVNNVVAGTNVANTGNSATLTFVGANIVGAAFIAGSLAPGSTTPLSSNPLLGPLAANDAASAPQTLSIGGGSPALNVAVGSCPATDERGVARPQSGACDIGAFEASATDDRIFANGFN
jgi:hypothetical protein